MKDYNKKIKEYLVDLFKKSGVKGGYVDFDKKKDIIEKVEKRFKIDCQELKKNKHLSIDKFFIFIKQEKIINFLNKNKTPQTKIPKVKKKNYSLSHAQRRMFVLYKLEPDSSFYNINFIQKIKGDFRISEFKQAVNKIIQRHEVFRTNFKEINGEPVQVIKKKLELKINNYELDKNKDKIKTRQEEKEIVKKNTQKPFKLETDNLLRVSVIKKSKDKHIFIISMHHIISDNWSMNIFYRELTEIYNSILENRKANLPELSIQYKDYAEWEQSKENQKRLKKQEKYWLKELSGELPVLNLPTDKTRPAMQTYNGDTKYISIDKNTVKKLRQLAEKNNTTLFALLFAVFNVFLHKISGQNDIIVGTLRAQREMREIENIIGLLHNNLAIRTKIKDNNDFEKLLKGVKQKVLKAISNNEYSFDQLVEKVEVNRDMSRSPLFNVLFRVREDSKKQKEIARFKNLDISFKKIKSDKTAQFDLDCLFFDINKEKKELGILFKYNTDLFKEETIERFLVILKTLIQNITNKPKQKIKNLEIISKQEKQKLLYTFNNTNKEYPKNKTIQELFEEQVKRTPKRIAIEFEDKTLTYEELNKKSNQLAHYLIGEKSLKLNSVIGIIADRSLEMVIAVIGALKAGGTYLPIDPAYPSKRINHLLKNVNILITNISNKKKYKASSIDIVNLDHNWFRVINNKKLNNKKLNTSKDSASIIFTSGSTGVPRGVELSHKGIINFCYNQINIFNIDKQDNISQNLSYSVVASTWQLFAALFVGAKLTIYKKNISQDPDKLFQAINKGKNTLLEVGPTLLGAHLKEQREKKNTKLLTLRAISVGGEIVTSSLVKSFYRKYSIPFFSTYGLTEYSCDALHYLVPINNTDIIFSGRPSNNTQVYILNQDQKLQPIGIPGELYISGDGLARGYVNDPKKTREVFLPHPFIKGKRIYKTGDLAKMHPDGNIEILGRVDHQIKIRGYRIEPGEIETNLKKHNKIKDVVVMAKEIKEKQNKQKENKNKQEQAINDKYLVAYYTSNNRKKISSSELKEKLKQNLPDYMIPNYFVHLAEMPLNANGKLDRLNLPEPKEKDLDKNKYIAPKTEIEKKVAKIWQEVLKVKKISRNDNFFNLGGHSLKAIQVLSRINSQFKINLGLKQIFISPIVYEISEDIEKDINKQKSKKNKTPQIIINKAKPKENYSLSHAQRRMFVLYKLESDSSFYNINNIREISGEFKIDVFQKAVNKLIQRHEAFRTSFKEINGEPVQIIKKKLELKINNYELRNNNHGLEKKKDAGKTNQAEQEERIKKIIKKYTLSPFKLESDPLIRVAVIKIKEGSDNNKKNNKQNKHILIISMHHIISDGWSMNVFYRELTEIYNSILKNRKANLPKLSIQYKDYAEWEQSKENQKRLKKQEKYWLKELSGELPVLNLPTDKPRPAMQTYNGDTKYISIDKNTVKKLRQIAEQNNTTLFTLLFAVFNLFLHKISGQSDIIVGTLRAQREIREIENIIGLLHNNLAIRTKIKDNNDFEKLLKEVKQKVLKAISNNEYSFDQLVEKVEVNRDMSRSPLFNVLFRVWENNKKEREINFKNANVNFKKGINDKTTQFDLDCVFFDIDKKQKELGILFKYNTDLFNQETIERFLVMLKTLTKNIVNNPKQKINNLEIIPKQEKQKLLHTFNNTNKEYPKNKTIQELFEEQVKKTPKKIAIEFEDKTLSYQELNKKANQLAHYLIKQEKVKRGDILALISERNPESIIAIFAILKAGATYLPIDPAYPQDRIEYMLNQSKAKLLLSAIDKKSKVYAILNKLSNKKSSNNDVGDIKKRGDSRRLRIIDINKRFINSIDISEKYIEKGEETDLAYVIYTSGSTGNPKGVKIEHRAILNTLYWLQDYFKLTKNDVIAQKTALSFTDSVWEIFWPLINGAKLSIFSDNIVKDPKLFIKNLKEKKISYTQFVPALMTVFLEYGKSGYYIDNKVNNVKAETIKNKGNKKERKEGETNTILPNLKYIFNGGEALPPSLANKWYKTFPNVKIANIYGMTESAIYATNYIVPKESDENQISVPLGKPIANEKVYILDNNDKICPLNIPGQIAISGKSLASGYLHNKEITKKSFIKSKQTKEILYKTGDLGKIDYNFNLHYLGRTDHQVKVRGYRVELGEIESIIRKRKDISQCAVIHKKNKQNSDDLYAFYIAKKEIDSDIIKDYIKKYLPNYMVPSFVIYLEEFPLNVHGKIDRKELHKHKIEPKLKNNYQKPEGEIEKRLAKIWREVLGIKRVSRNDNFFNLGGHSLKAIQVLSRINSQFKIDLGLKKIFTSSTIYEISSIIEKETKKKNKTSQIKIPKAKKKKYYKLSHAQRRMFVLYKLESDSSFYNLNFVQNVKGDFKIPEFKQAINKLIQRHEAFRTNFKEINGEPVQVIKKELELKINNYELRNNNKRIDFNDINKECIKIYDLSEAGNVKEKINQAEQEERINKIIKKYTLSPFKLESDPLIRVAVIKIKEGGDNNKKNNKQNKHILVISIHHIIFDGWSMNIFYRELTEIYNSILENKKINLPKLSMQYKDYAEWEQSKENQKRLKKQEKYWLKELSGELPVLNLPTDKPRRIKKKYKEMGGEFVEINSAIVKKIKIISKENNVTFFVFLFTVFNLLLHRITGQKRLIVKNFFANRQNEQLSNVIGLLFNSLPIKTDIKDNYCFLDLLKIINEKILNAHENHDFYVDSILNKKRELEYEDNRQISEVIFQFFEKREGSNEMKGISTEFKKVLNAQDTNFDLHFVSFERDNNLMAIFKYNKDLFNSETIKGFLNIFNVVISEIADLPSKQIKEISAISEQEKQRLLTTYNGEEIEFPQEKSMIELFREKAKQYPKKTAIQYENNKFSYKELDNEIRKTKELLIKKGVRENDKVCIFLERSINSVVAMFSILDIGAVYIPIDISYPKERVDYIIDDTNAKLIITTNELKEEIINNKEIDLFLIDKKQEEEKTAKEEKITKVEELNNKDKRKRQYNENNLASIYYTSGSTGNPKGIMITERSMKSYIFSGLKAIEKRSKKINENNLFCQNLPAGYIISMWQFFAPLMLGAKLTIHSDDIAKNPIKFFKQIKKDKISIIQTVPSFLSSYIEELKTSSDSKTKNDIEFNNLIELQLTGENIFASTVNDFYEKNKKTKLINLYGSTETVDDSLHYEIPRNKRYEKILAGRPFSLKTYILDKEKRLLPIGITGELYVSGKALSEGYLDSIPLRQGFEGQGGVNNAPAEQSKKNNTLTKQNKEVFISNPFIKGERMYKTGDLAKMHPDGNIEILGRSDNLVNLRGNRIELGEIETNLRKYNKIERVVVLTKQEDRAEQVKENKREQGKEKIIIAYYKAKKQIKQEDLREFLSQKLPRYMIPADFIHINDFPLNSSGKIDKLALLKIKKKKKDKNKYIAPKTETEKRVAKIWQEVLDVKRVNRNDNFFNLGGHSLKAIQVVSRINSQFKIDLGLKEVFKYIKLYELSKKIDDNKKGHKNILTKTIIPRTKIKNKYALSYVQEKMFNVYKNEPKSSFLNINIIDRVEGNFNIDIFKKALLAIIERHESLRTNFKEIKGKIMQIIYPKEKYLKLLNENSNLLKIYDYSNKKVGISEKEYNVKIKKIIKERTLKPFKLKNEPLIRVVIIKEKYPKKYIVLTSIHHIIADDWSIRIFKRDLMAVYNGFLINKKPNLPKINIQYKDYSEWEQSKDYNEKLKKQEKYWRRKIGNKLPILNLPIDKPRPVIQSNVAEDEIFIIDKETMKKIKKLASKKNTTVPILLFSVLNLFLYKKTKQNDILIGILFDNRNYKELDNLIGLFINTLAIRTKIKSVHTFDKLISINKNNFSEALNNKDYSFERLSEKNNFERGPERNPFFDVAFQYFQTSNEKGVGLKGVKVISRGVRKKTTKFDIKFIVEEIKDNFIAVVVRYNKSLFSGKLRKKYLNEIKELIEYVLKDSSKEIEKYF
jgi:tyrocidine synthetase-3